MRRVVVVGCVLAVGFGSAGPELTLADDAPPASSRRDELLAEWERRTADIRTVDARFARVDDEPEWKMKTRYDGRLLLKGTKQARLDLSKVREGGAKLAYERIVRTPDVVYHYKMATRQIFAFPLERGPKPPLRDPNGRAVLDWLLASIADFLRDDRPPFLFTMRAADAKRQYEITFVGETPQVAQIRLVPRHPKDIRQIHVWLDKATFLPAAVRLHLPNGKDTQTYWFQDVKFNGEIDDADFQFKPRSGWQVHPVIGGAGPPLPPGLP
jgi:outer membrane lipoprotein-sorting protein